MAGRTRKQNKPYDDAFKLLAEGDAEALLLLLGEIKLGEPVEITPLHSELRISTKLPDQAYKVVTASGARIVHIEAQSSYDHLMPERMADYGAREWMKYRLPVTCYVLLLTDRQLPRNPVTTGRIDAGDVQITVRFRLVRLSQISAAQMLKTQREHLLPFVPLMQGGQKELIAGARALRKVKQESKQLELGLYFSVLGGLRYNPADLLDLVWRESMIPLRVLKESPTYEFLINEGKDQWKEEGKIEGLSNMLRLLIAKRFPKLNVKAKIKRIYNPALLELISLEVVDMTDAAVSTKRSILKPANERPPRAPAAVERKAAAHLGCDVCALWAFH